MCVGGGISFLDITKYLMTSANNYKYQKRLLISRNELEISEIE